MKCNESYPQGSYEECTRTIGHSGDHEYFAKKWSRPEPAEPNPDVEAILDRADRETRAWGTDERSYPVVIERTLTYVYWVDADCEDSALKDASDNAWETDLSKETPIGGYDEVRRLDGFERREAFEATWMGFAIGPQIACPDCGKLSMSRAWFHDPYRKCHGPIVWRQHPGARRPWNERNATPVYDAARKAVAA